MSTENQGQERPKLGPVPDPAPENDWTTLFDVPPAQAPVAGESAPAEVTPHQSGEPIGAASTGDDGSPWPAAPSPRRAKWLFAGVCGLLAAIVIGGGVAAVNAVSGSDDPPASLLPESSSVAAQACESSASGPVTTGNGAGDGKSPAGAVLAFQYGYYVQRDADAALKAVAKDRIVGDSTALQKGIDAVPEGTTHCVSITTESKNTAEVEIIETHPDGTELVHEQTVTTTRDGDRVVIETIKENK